MSIWDWVKGLLFPAPQRDVSRLDGVSGTDVVLETIDVSGKPLREGHRRRAWRDPRLLPKRKSFLPLWKRQPLFSQAEGQRLFGSTMRTRNRQLRDLLCDEEQLKRYGLPVWKTEIEVAAALGISLRELFFFAMHRDKETVCHYVTFAIPKRRGGERVIMAPKKRLKALQRQLLELLVNKLPVSEWAHGFRSGRSVKTGAQPHVGKKVLLHLDVQEFFPSVHVGRVRGLLIALGYSFPVATTLATMMTEAERQPVQIDEKVFYVPVSSRYCIQGAPTSPGVCNAIFLKADHRLAKLAQKFGFVYSRYADDLTFSGDAVGQVYGLKEQATRILRDEGLAVNENKTRIMRSGGAQKVTGVTVNAELGLSRKERRRLRAAIHHQGKTNGASATQPESLARLHGKLAYLQMLNPAQADHLRKKLPTANEAEPR